MPLFKRKPFALAEKPDDLNPQELVYQIPLTKEILRNYNEYLMRINLYRKRVWTCKATGKGNLTYEEALISEERASKRIQNIPVQYIAPILREIQFSMLNLKDLVDSISAKLLGPFPEGAEMYGRKDGRLHLCKITKVVEAADKKQYEIEWLSGDNKMSGKALLNDDALTLKNPPFSKRVLKSFIKDSTYRSLPWVLHDNISKKHSISSTPPEELKINVSIQNGLVVCNKKRKRSEEKQNTVVASEKKIIVYTRRNKLNSHPSLWVKITDGGNEHPEDQSTKYPIDDLLVQPTAEDQLLTERPPPCRDFNIPMNCVGNLLMVWDFCASYGKLLNLSPFSLEDFENSLCYKDSVPLLIVESCSALLRLLVRDNVKFSMAIKNRKRKPKITQITWTEYLCDFLETTSTAELSTHISTIKRGHYALLEIHVKLAIFVELVDQVLETSTVKEKLDEYIEEIQALAAARRDEALDEGRKKREEKERRKSEANGKEVNEKLSVKSGVGINNGVTPERSNAHALSRSNGNSENEQGDGTSKKSAKKQKVEINTSLEDANLPSKREIHKLMKEEIKETIENKSAEERKQFLEREIEKRIIRTYSLGKDRNHCRYWFFRREGRIFLESSDFTEWGYYQTKEELDALIGSLNTKGERERALKKQLQKFYDKICLQIQKRSKEATQGTEMEEAMVRRSTRVRAPPRDNPTLAFLKYVNKWKDI
ncbi:hypothetical protein ACS0TY_030267 [Phlomoides rotata]